MHSKQAIASELRGACLEIEEKVVGWKDRQISEEWAIANSLRHAHTIRSILRHVEQRGLKSVRILNASGLACGHQDVSIVGYLRDKVSVHWTVFESPTSPYLSNDTLKKKITELNIQLNLCDFATAEELYGHEDYDIVLFTEVAEHLEHGALLRALKSIEARLAVGGMLILTTPNLASIGSRWSLLKGNGDLGYWGDGQANCEKRLWGHIVYYDLRRLARILSDAGLSISGSFTFWYKPDCKNVKTTLMYLFSFVVPNSKQTLFIEASKASATPIPFQI